MRCEQLDIGYIDGMLLLPLIIEHTIGAFVIALAWQLRFLSAARWCCL